MGLSSFFNPDILIGMGQAHQEKQKNLLTQETERRKGMSDRLKMLIEHPDILDEARDEGFRQLSDLTMADPNKPLKKNLVDFNRILNVQPQVGKSVVPSRTMNVQAPGGTSTANTPLPESMSLPELHPPEWQGPPTPQRNTAPSSVPMRTNTLPVDLSYTLDAPTAGPDVRRSGFRTQYDKDVIADDQETRKYEATRRQIDEQIRRDSALQEAQLKNSEKLLPPPDNFIIGADGTVMNKTTGEIVRQGTPKVPNPPNYSKDTVLYKGSPTNVLQDIDPASPTKGHFFLPTPSGLQDITGQTDYFRPPPQSISVGGLSGPVNTAVQKLSSEFDKNPIVLRYNEALLNAANVQEILNSKWSGPGDMSIVFQFMRALDPTSVVRESEYETARKTGNWFGGVFAKFNGLFNEGGGFLSDQVKKDFNKVLQSRIRQASTQVKNIYNDYGRRIDLISGQKGSGQNYLTDYTTMLPQSMLGELPPPAATTATPASKAPSGVDQEVWDVMTPQERALWKN